MTAKSQPRSIIRNGMQTLLILCCVCLPQAHAEPEVRVEETYYSVSGTTAQQIRSSLNRNTPVQQNGQLFDAHTQWDIRWQFWWNADSNGNCRLTRVSTQVVIRYTLPQLQKPETLPEELLRRWKKYLGALVAHEEGHAAIGIDAARAIEHRLLQMGERSSCDQLEIAANRLAQKILNEYAKIDDQYDADTEYGTREGAQFP